MNSSTFSGPAARAAGGKSSAVSRRLRVKAGLLAEKTVLGMIQALPGQRLRQRVGAFHHQRQNAGSGGAPGGCQRLIRGQGLPQRAADGLQIRLGDDIVMDVFQRQLPGQADRVRKPLRQIHWRLEDQGFADMGRHEGIP